MQHLPNPRLHQASSADGVFALRYGCARAPLALVVPDRDWPGMWRIAWPDSRLSDLVNLPRAKDPAEAISERGPPARNRRLFHWHTSNSHRPASTAGQTTLAATSPATPSETGRSATPQNPDLVAVDGPRRRERAISS
jgi:hypothetical protein